MTKNLITLGRSARLSEVPVLFKKYGIHHLPIVEDDVIEGLITTWDLLWLKKSIEEFSAFSTADVMTKKLVKLEPSDKIGTATELFLKNSFHAIPIVGDSDKLLGLITSFDILKYTFTKEYPNQQWDWLR